MNGPVLVVGATFAGLLGLAIGSFLNVVAHRVPRGESVVSPPSRCPACGAGVRARHNVPVLGWLVLRGRCFDCRTPISARYPLVEASTGLLFAAMAVRFAETPALVPAYVVLAGVSVVLALIDLDVHRLPNAIVLPAYPAVGGLLVLGGDGAAMVRALLAAGVLLAVFLAIALAAPRGMGFGDVKLSGVVGLALGHLSWGTVLVGGFLPFVLGALVGVGLVVTGRAGRSSALPFGPFMLLGAWVAILGGGALGDAYLSLLGF